jgi:enoyl-CoA hydratase
MHQNLITNQPSDGVALLRINRPDKLNALNEAVLSELAAALGSLAADDTVRALVLTGDERAFAAGADVAEMLDKTPAEMATSPRASYWDALRVFPKPLIAAVSGWCLGGGNELAMSCDMIIASETARFGQPEINLAIIPGAGGTQRLTRAVGKAVTMEMVLAARTLSAYEALELGLVNHVMPVELYLQKSLDLASIIASKAPLSVRMAKDAVNRSFEHTLVEGLSMERRNYLLLAESEDRREGITAFLEKRTPHWKGR